LIPTIHKYDAERDDYDYANHRRNSASSAEFVGPFWLR
jgi:hypothetical protein